MESQIINDRFIKKLAAPTNAPHKIYWDDKLTGFGVRITKNSAIAFVLRYVISGRERKYTIGGFPELSSVAAREIALKLKGDILKGHDPLNAKKESSKVTSIDELAKDYLANGCKRLRDKTADEYGRLLKNHILPKFGKYKLDAIKVSDIENFHTGLKSKLHTANRVLTMLSILFQYAIKCGLIERNPVLGISKFYEEKRHRYMADEEIKAFLIALEKRSDSINTLAVKLLLLTGSRKNEILKATWDQFDLERGIWLKTADSTKQKKTSIVILNGFTVEILKDMKNGIVKDAKQAKGIVSTNKHLFFNTDTGKPLQDVKRFFISICKEGGITGLRIHDLRHTFASILVTNNISLEKTGALIGHSNTATTQRYAHLSSQSLLSATEIVGKKIRDLMG